MTPQELKNSILQMAIQGKLVEQRPEEGTAEELYRQIQEEKKRLIKEGKIKKEKPLPEISEDEVPFEIPGSWKWVRWGNLSYSIQYGYNAPAQTSGRIKMVRISDIQDGCVQWDTVPFCDIDEKEIPFYLLRKNDILFARTGGTVGKSYLVKDVPEESIYAGYLIRTRYSEKLCPEYMKAFMESQLYWNRLRNGTIATAQPNCNGKTLAKMILPLPPLAEQERIVAKIEEFLPYIACYEQAWNRLEEFNKRFPIDVQKSLLQWAIQGKLVEQRPEEGTAEELYQKIQEEKQRLVKEGKIKKEKPLPEIGEDDMLFEIPGSWIWCRLGNILYKLTDGTHSTPKYTASGVPFLSVKDMSSGQLDFSSCKYISEQEHQELFSRCNPEYGDLLLTKIGTTGIPVIVNTDKQFSLFVSVALLKFCQELIDNKFLQILLNSPLVQTQATENTRGVGNKNWVMRDIANTLIVLPPLAEQKRIVAKLEELLPLCERLK